MSPEDKDIIRRYAAGASELRQEAIAAHRRAIPTDGVRGTPEPDFMAEIDNPVPDVLLRSQYRMKLLQRPQVYRVCAVCGRRHGVTGDYAHQLKCMGVKDWRGAKAVPRCVQDLAKLVSGGMSLSRALIKLRERA